MTWYSVYVATRNPAGGEAQAELPGLDDFADALAAYSGSVAGGQAGWSGTVSYEADSPVDAAYNGHEIVLTFAYKASLPMWPVVRVEAVDHDELARDLANPLFPDLIGAAEAAQLLGVSRQRIHDMRKTTPGFPHPAVEVAMGPLWTVHSIERFVETWTRRPGRPAAVHEAT